MRRRNILTLLLPLLFAACGNAARSSSAASGAMPVDTADYHLPLPMPPKGMTDPQQRAGFLANHLWDGMDWNDTVLLSSERIMGEGMANYGLFLSMLEAGKASSVVNAMVNRLSGNPRALDVFADYAYTYFYYPDAPQYDAELYLHFLNPLIAVRSLPESTRLRLQTRREEIMKNRVGTIAQDFSFVDSDGNTRRLSESGVGAEVRVLMMYDPDCEVCDEAIGVMNAPGRFSDAVREGRVAVIAINAFGQDQGGKAIRKKGMPREWIVGYSPDGELDMDEIYVIRATPAIYVLDSEGRILDKDLSIAKLRQFVE